MDRVMWLATGASNGQVRGIAWWKLAKLATRLKSEAATGEAEQARHALLAADIKRFLERPADPARLMPAPAAPPGAPLGVRDWASWLRRRCAIGAPSIPVGGSRRGGRCRQWERATDNLQMGPRYGHLAEHNRAIG